MADDGTLAIWIGTARRILKSGGVLTMIWRADGLADLLAALTGQFGSIAVQGIHAAAEKTAIRVLVRGTKGGKAPLVVHAGAFLDSETTARVLRGEGLLALGVG